MVPSISSIVDIGSVADIQCQEYKTISQENQSYAEGALKEARLPSDTTIKRLIVRVFGTFQITHSGAPTFDEGGFLGRIISFIQLSEGNDTFKTIDPLMHRRLQALWGRKAPSRRVGTGATAAAATAAAAEASAQGAPSAAPVTGHYIFIDEFVAIDLEDPLASDNAQKQATLWSTQGKNNCRVRVQCGTIANLAEAGALGTGVSYGNINLTIETTLVTVPHVKENPKFPFLVYQESLIPINVPAGSTSFGFQMPKSASKILGLSFLVRDTSASLKLSDTAIKKLRLTGNNSRFFLDSSWKGLQGVNQETYGPADNNMVAGRHSLSGFASASFRRDGDIANNGIPSDLDSLILGFEASGSSDTPSESGNIQLLVAVQELRSRVR